MIAARVKLTLSVCRELLKDSWLKHIPLSHTHTCSICIWELSVPSGYLCRAVTHAASWSTRRPGLTWIKPRECPFQICRGPQRHIRSQSEPVKKTKGESESEREREMNGGKRKEAEDRVERRGKLIKKKIGREGLSVRERNGRWGGEGVCVWLCERVWQRKKKMSRESSYKTTRHRHTYNIISLFPLLWPKR